MHGNYEEIETKKSLLQLDEWDKWMLAVSHGHYQQLMICQVCKYLFLACGGFRLLVHCFISFQKTIVSHPYLKM